MRLLPSRKSCSALEVPKVLGMVPKSWLDETSNHDKAESFPKLGLIVPVSWFNLRWRICNDWSLDNWSGSEPVSLLLNKSKLNEWMNEWKRKNTKWDEKCHWHANASPPYSNKAHLFSWDLYSFRSRKEYFLSKSFHKVPSFQSMSTCPTPPELFQRGTSVTSWTLLDLSTFEYWRKFDPKMHSYWDEAFPTGSTRRRSLLELCHWICSCSNSTPWGWSNAQRK